MKSPGSRMVSVAQSLFQRRAAFLVSRMQITRSKASQPRKIVRDGEGKTKLDKGQSSRCTSWQCQPNVRVVNRRPDDEWIIRKASGQD